MTSSGVQPALGVAGDRIRPEWLVPRERDALLAAAAVALHAQLVEHEPERLGTCASTAAATPSRMPRRARTGASARSPARTASGSPPSAAAGRREPPSYVQPPSTTHCCAVHERLSSAASHSTSRATSAG